jgi:hypothetical protein
MITHDPIAHMNEHKRLHRERGTSGGRRRAPAKAAPQSEHFDFWLETELTAIAAQLSALAGRVRHLRRAHKAEIERREVPY